MKRISLILVMVGVIVLGFGIAYAAPDSDTQNSIVTLTVPHSVRLDIDNADATKILNLDGDSEVDFEAGETLMTAGYPTLSVRANKSWKLFAKSSGFGAVDGYNKEVTDLMLVNTGAHKSNGFDAFKALTLADQEVASYGTGINNDSNPMQYKVKLDWAKDIPGTYVATVTYTLATQG
ncbi:MAG: hypothetical protein Q8N76_05505 [Candidatus Omnitrophota bacterium]|nr:hypothetical protein [Candidatus Omnitrophota bacterium]